jgi:PAS domain S-box-containing protein
MFVRMKETRISRKPRWWAMSAGWTAGCVAAFVLLVATSATGFVAFRALGHARASVEKTFRALRVVDQVVARLAEAETSKHGFLLTRDPEYLETYRRADADARATLSELQQETSHSANQEEPVRELVRLAQAKLAHLAQTTSVALAGDHEAAMRSITAGEGKRLMDEIRDHASQMGESQEERLAARSQHVVRMRWANAILMTAVALLGIGLAIGIVFANADFSRRHRMLNSEIQARLDTQAALAESQEQYRITLRSIGDAVISTDAEGRISFMNAVAEDLTGWSLADARGRPIEDVFHIVNEDTRAVVENPLVRVLAEGRIVGLANHTLLISRSGTECPIDDSGAPIRDSRGELTGAVLVFRDISERRRAEIDRKILLESERAARQEAERAGRVKDDFLANLAHELRTPLNSILGWTQLLRRGSLSQADQAQAVETIERNARLQGQLISDLLDMSAISSGKLRMDLRPTDLAAVVGSVVDSAGPSAAAKGISVYKSLDESAGPVLGDFNRLQQIIWNLVSNAIKFTPERGRIVVSLKRVGDDAELAVSDTGIGIAPAFLPHVFDRFRQQDSGRDRRYSGLGLGLAIAKQLVEWHHGTIHVTSDGEGGGATFHVTLPICDAGSVANPDANPPRGTPDTTRLAGLRVLLVDDDSDSRDFVNRILSEHGIHVTQAASGPAALEAVQSQPVDLLISDIGMPQMDGYELLRRVRALPPERGGNVIALALTAFARPEDRTRTTTSGYSTHIAKPLEPSRLISAIAELAGRQPSLHE